MRFIHLHRKGFMLFNGLFILAVSVGQIISPDHFWRFLGVMAGNPHLGRVTGWYLLTFGVCAMLIRRAPEQYPVVVGALGFEKAGAMVLLAPELWRVNSNLALALLGTVDGTLALLLFGYLWWLLKKRGPQRITTG